MENRFSQLKLQLQKMMPKPLLYLKGCRSVYRIRMSQSDSNSEGKYADIIAVKGDVLRYISLLQDVDLVVKKGTRFK